MDHPSPIEPGAVVAYEIDLFATSYLVAAGHRIRVDISSSCFDRYDRNPNTGLPFGRSPATIVADQEIHHSPAAPSCVHLPIVRTPA